MPNITTLKTHTFWMLGWISHMTDTYEQWMFRIFTSLPIVSAGTARFKAWVGEMVQKRMDVSRRSPTSPSELSRKLLKFLISS